MLDVVGKELTWGCVAEISAPMSTELNDLDALSYELETTLVKLGCNAQTCLTISAVIFSDPLRPTLREALERLAPLGQTPQIVNRPQAASRTQFVIEAVYERVPGSAGSIKPRERELAKM
ncbi:hypothetical protein GCM10007989_34710 [Devosia pacifica]|uniref:Uncharacterized protein n=1 Tax=Devosia pacifica TaxID=1335967 RepID=A0A918VYH6_9HYPH|nr:hypothetical protein GCM10007989_34710 [Devosia pacifica]